MSYPIQFSVGQRVRITEDVQSETLGEPFRVGLCGEVLKVDASDPVLPYKVMFDGVAGKWWMRAFELEPAAREWVLRYPPAPGPEVTRIAPVDAPDRVYTRDGDRWIYVAPSGKHVHCASWDELLTENVNGVREVED